MEEQRLWVDAVVEALGTYHQFLRQPCRYLSADNPGCPCCDPLQARDQLDDALAWLPPAAEAELGTIVSRLDDEFERRTIPDPWIRDVSTWAAEAWWHQRSQER
ncbi:hypothetical protein ACIBI4_14020 [Streptomyces sp. NPDC050418]|uniref:hypothetical protein n=1 Tax=Streptomyces sp. NPDC050418 TaxID=3365612 RepID=UPI0037AF46AA